MVIAGKAEEDGAGAGVRIRVGGGLINYLCHFYKINLKKNSETKFYTICYVSQGFG